MEVLLLARVNEAQPRHIRGNGLGAPHKFLCGCLDRIEVSEVELQEYRLLSGLLPQFFDCLLRLGLIACSDVHLRVVH